MPPTLGQRLKHARDQRGLSLRDVEHATRIPVARLQDLEADRLNGLGGMTYARSFLRTYAALMEVDADDVLAQMKPPPLGGVRDYRYLVETHGSGVAPRRDRQRAASSKHALSAGRSFLFATIICLISGVLIGGAVLANALFNSKSAAPAPSQQQDSATARPSPVASPTADPTNASPHPPSLPAGADTTARPGESPPPKAQAVEEARRALPLAPKAEAVR
jgi:cytoskeleton protein RodZ